MKSLGIGVVGTGRIGRMHVENLIKFIQGAHVVAVADIFADKCTEWANSLGITNVYADYRDLIANPEVQAVVVASSTDTHAEIIIAAARAGKHVFCEKPLDLDVERIKTVLEEVDKAGIKLQIGFNRRFDHNFRRVRELVQDGSVGDVHIVRIASRDPAPPPVEYVKVSGGIFVDMMIHDFDMVRYLSGSDVEEVYAIGNVLVDPAIGEAGDIDTAIVTLKFKNGAIGVIDNSRQAVYGYDQRVEVFGSKGQAIANNDKPTTVELSTENSVTTDKIPYFFLQRYEDSYIDEYKCFVEAIFEDKTPIVTGIDGLRSVQIALAATRSLKEGRPIRLED